MESRLGPSFKKIKALCYSERKQGFYVYAKPNKCDPKSVVKYIGRPVIATSRIDKYDGEFVTFHYNRHEDNKYVKETLPATYFIKRLIRHIPEKHFIMIRYGGIYAIVKLTNICIVLLRKKSITFFVVSISGVLLFFLLLDMTLCSVLIVTTKWSFLNSTTITSMFPSKNFTRK